MAVSATGSLPIVAPKPVTPLAPVATTASATTPPPAPAADALPPEWTEHTAPDGRKYYCHKTTKETTWTKPAPAAPPPQPAQPATTPPPAPAADALPPEWTEHTAADGRKYYSNKL